MRFFQRMPSEYLCLDCGKLTMDTGQGEGEHRLCLECKTAYDYLTQINKGRITLEDVPPEYRDHVANLLD